MSATRWGWVAVGTLALVASGCNSKSGSTGPSTTASTASPAITQITKSPATTAPERTTAPTTTTTAPTTTTTTTPPIASGQTALTSPAGNLYRAGEFCPERDLGISTQGSDGTIICSNDNGYDRWLKG
jgi:hypothetical protein